MSQHKHDWQVWQVASQFRGSRDRGPVTARHATPFVQAKILYHCIVDECGEIRVELYEGTPEGLPAEPLPPEIANLPADHESRVRP